MNVTPRDRKFLIIGGAAVCAFIILKFLLFPFYDGVVQRKNDVALKEKTKVKYLAFLQDRAKIQDRLNGSSREQANVQKSLLRGETPALAAADIQKVVDGFAKESKVSVQSVKVMDPEQDENFTVVPVQIIFSSDLTRLRKFIQGIERDRKLLTIPELKIRVKNQIRPQDISVTLEVAGFMKKGETKN